MAVDLTAIFTPDSLKVPLDGLDKEEVIEELIDLLVRAGRVADRDAALEAVNEREAKRSTGLGDGVALPHGKSSTVHQLTGALGVSADGVEFDSADGAPVHVVFLVLADAAHPGPHVECLAEIARLLRTPGFYRRLVACRNAEEAYEILRAEQ